MYTLKAVSYAVIRHTGIGINVQREAEGRNLFPWMDQMNEWCLRLRFCTVKAIMGRRQTGRMRWMLLWTMPLAQDRSLDLLASSPVRYHCKTKPPLKGSLKYATWPSIVVIILSHQATLKKRFIISLKYPKTLRRLEKVFRKSARISVRNT